MDLKKKQETDIKSDALFLEKLVEYEPNGSYRVEIRDEGPPYFGEESWEEVVSGQEALQFIKAMQTEKNFYIQVGCYGSTLKTYTLVEFYYGHTVIQTPGGPSLRFNDPDEDIDVSRVFEKLNKNYCMRSGLSRFYLLVSHSPEEILSVLDASSAYKELVTKNNLIVIISDPKQSMQFETSMVVYANQDNNFDFFDVTKPLIFDVDFGELCSVMKYVEDTKD